MSDAQVRFSTTHYDGTQKLTRREVDRLRAVNPAFLVLNYRLGLGLGYREVLAGCRPIGEWLRIVEGNDWVREWPAAEPPTAWFFPWAGQARVLNCDWGWYLMELNDTGFRQYWHNEILRQIQANAADGVFMDSLSVPNFLGADHYNPALPDVDTAFESSWTTRVNNWLTWLQSQPVGSYYLIPNAGSWITSRDAVDYSRADGVMVEGFALEADESPYALEDWKLQMNRILRLVSSGKTVIAQTYVTRPEDRMFTLGSYLLIRGNRTYLNLELDLDPEWWPEYDIPVGQASESAASSNIDSLWDSALQLYRRRFDNGLVLANPEGASTGPRTVALDRTYYQAVTSGGGPVPDSGIPTGTLSYRAVTSITLAAGRAAVLLTAQPR
jgi:hypothetical protein